MVQINPNIPNNAWVRYLYYPGEGGGTVQRVTDPVWSAEIYTIEKRTSQFKTVKGRRITTGPILYLLKDGPSRSFVQELQIVPKNTELPPSPTLA